jgi:hypothetical protein
MLKRSRWKFLDGMDPEKRLQSAALLSETCRTLLGEGIKNAIQTTMKSK